MIAKTFYLLLNDQRVMPAG